jgi:hypothetical protein
MKKVLLTLFAGLCFISVFSQSEWYHFAEDFYFVKEVPVSDYRGMNFRYEIAVKSNPADTLSKVRIHGIAVGKGSEDYLNSNFTVESREEQDWTIYTVIGTVNPEAFKLWFYAAVNGNGNFYFDDISFYVEDSPKHWKQLELYNHSFEEKNNNIFAGYFVSKRKSAGIHTVLTGEVAKTGQHSLLVTTTGAVSAPSITAQNK